MDTSSLAASPAVDQPALDIFRTMLEPFLRVRRSFLLSKIITDVFRSPDVSDRRKAGWPVLVIVLPLIGVLACPIARGEGMGKRDLPRAQQAEAVVQAYVRDAAGTSGARRTAADGGGRGHVDDLATLADPKDEGLVSAEEYQRAEDGLPG
ncbi:SHOCT domain-containing protein [Kitasatospora sp. NPDC048722]|uniref:SHOCT domain-containing protein n=1 Tax=Kitasatospora sp. NPDC048722 TaxID=3155639 RepID=UPI0034048A06